MSRIAYLGALHPDGPLSRHLRSRVAVGRILLDAGVPTVVLQAGVVVGSGSASFEMIRQLTDVLPYMPAPRWVRNRIQPIAVRDVLHYLLAAAELPPEVSRAFDIGGPDILRYGQMMNGYGDRGWYSFPLAWALRGWLDKLAGGVGLRRGRRDADRLQTGDSLDWWRVEAIERGSALRLRAEMRVPGLAWLELGVTAEGAGSRYRQRAVFFPQGLAGRLYWLAILPFHGIIFAGMAERIVVEAERAARAEPPRTGPPEGVTPAEP